MHNTSHFEMNLPIANCAVGYTQQNWFGPTDGQRRAWSGDWSGGRALGRDTFALQYRDLGYTVIVLSNYDRPSARRIVEGIAALLVA
jgi:hypothetical protein